jgi:polysaccharide deacetylase family protein (PEP-CTERM system associated)
MEAYVKSVLSIDVEDWYHSSLDLFKDSPIQHGAKPEPSVVDNTLQALDLLSKTGNEATFFVLGTVAEHYPDIVREILNKGYEVATHGYSHKLVYNMKPEEFEDDLKISLEHLNRAGCAQVLGYRAPYWSVTKKSLWALEILIKLGFKYDSSIFPIKRGLYGIPGALPHPHQILKGFWEFPPATIQMFGTNWPIAGGGYLRLSPYRMVASAIRKSSGRQIMTFYFHPYELDPTDVHLKLGLIPRSLENFCLSLNLHLSMRYFRICRHTKRTAGMRILVITEEDEFYLPLSIDYLLKNCSEDIVEVVCARNPLLPSKFTAARKFCSAFGFGPIISQGLRELKAKVLDTFGWLDLTARYYSVKSVCRAHHTPYSYVEDINTPNFLRHCQELNIDLIASISPTQIFRENLINLPKHGCINIHTAKLPKYRGLYPTYWAMAYGEKAAGISIHYIEKGVDTGKIVLQDDVEIPPHTTLDYMLRTTKLRGAELLVKAIKQIAEGTVESFYPEGEGSYFSFPTPDSYKEFKSRGYKLW